MFERSNYMAGYYPCKNLQGKDVILVVVKRTYDLNDIEASCDLSEEQSAINLGDILFKGEDPYQSSIKYESDIAPWKVLKDIIFVGKAYAPKGKKSQSWDVHITVGPHKKSLKIFGPRTATWVPPREKGRGKKKELEPQPPTISKPKPISELELTYENAYGGFATFFPEDPSAFRKAIDREKKKADEKATEEAEQKKAEEKAQKEKQQKEQATQADKEQSERDQAHFFDGTKDIDDAPDSPLELEIGSAQRKAQGGTVVLDTAEIAEAQAREAALAADEKAQKEAQKAEAEGPEIDEDGAIKIDADELAELAAEATEAAQKVTEQQEGIRGTQVIPLDKMGDHKTADDSWIEEQRAERTRLYEEWGVAEQESVGWEEGDFPRFPYPSNPVGRGFALRNCKESIEGLELPLIEDPNRLITGADLPVDPATLHLPRPPAAGFGSYAKSWMPRSLMAGFTPDQIAEEQHRMDKQLVEELDPDNPEQEAVIDALMDRKPAELNPAYYNGAHPSLQVKELRGDEDVYLTNLDPSGKTYFSLPGSMPYVRFNRGDGWEEVDVDLDTLVIDREDKKVFMTWRGRVLYGGIEELETYPVIDIDVQDMTVAEWRDRQHDEQIDSAFKDKTAVIDVDEISAEDAAEFQKRILQAAVGLGGVKEDRSTDAVEGSRAEDGALIDLKREDVILSDDQWIEEAKLRGMSDDEIRILKMAKDERTAVQAQKQAMREKMAAIKKKKEEEEAEKAKNKKKASTAKKKASENVSEASGVEDKAPPKGTKGSKSKKNGKKTRTGKKK